MLSLEGRRWCTLRQMLQGLHSAYMSTSVESKMTEIASHLYPRSLLSPIELLQISNEKIKLTCNEQIYVCQCPSIRRHYIVSGKAILLWTSYYWKSSHDAPDVISSVSKGGSSQRMEKIDQGSNIHRRRHKVNSNSLKNETNADHIRTQGPFVGLESGFLL